MTRKTYFLISRSFLAILPQVPFSLPPPSSLCPPHLPLILIPFLPVVLEALLGLRGGEAWAPVGPSSWEPDWRGRRGTRWGPPSSPL